MGTWAERRKKGLESESSFNCFTGFMTTNSSVSVSNGIFTALPDFGAGVFDGRSYWLELAVRPEGSNAFTVLSPRQELRTVPLALWAAQVPDSGLSSNVVQLDSSPHFMGAVSAFQFQGDGSGLTNLVPRSKSVITNSPLQFCHYGSSANYIRDLQFSTEIGMSQGVFHQQSERPNFPFFSLGQICLDAIESLRTFLLIGQRQASARARDDDLASDHGPVRWDRDQN